jgi:enoyl-CoA hydratase/carnithine racemase
MAAEVAVGSAAERRRLVSLERRTADRPIRLNRPGTPDALSAALLRGLQAPRLSIFGLVSGVVPLAKLIEEAIRTAAKIVSFPHPVVMKAKGCVDQSYQAPLVAGLLFKRRMLRATSALTDRKQDMAPFSGKHAPEFRNQ